MRWTLSLSLTGLDLIARAHRGCYGGTPMRLRPIWRALVLAVALCPSIAAGQEPAEQDPYTSACAACHGADGRGMPRSVVGFDVPLPDFTDCSFATVEPDADWMAVAHDGGPARAFDRRMPAFGEALTAEQLQRTLDHIRGFCADPRWPRGELNLPRALVTEKAYPENETVLTTTFAATGRGTLVNELLYEQRIGARAQFEIMLPFAAHHMEAGWRSGLGDVAVAIKRVIAHSLDAGRIVSGSAEVILPTGSETDGIGSGTVVFEPFVTFGQLLPRDAFVQAHVGLELPRSGAKEGFWRAAFGKTFVQSRFGRAWSPMLEVLGARDFEDGARTHWDLLPQMQVSLSKRQHILLNVGVRVPVNQRDGRPAQVLSYFLWDWFDGGLLDGWR